MKKQTFFNTFFIALLSIAFFSCNKSATLDSEMLNKANHADPNEELIRFEEALTYGISLLQENETIIIWKSGEKYDWDVKDIHEFRNLNANRKDHDCESSSALTFAKCVKKLVDDGKCVTVGSDNGVYWGDIVDCP